MTHCSGACSLHTLFVATLVLVGLGALLSVVSRQQPHSISSSEQLREEWSRVRAALMPDQGDMLCGCWMLPVRWLGVERGGGGACQP